MWNFKSLGVRALFIASLAMCGLLAIASAQPPGPGQPPEGPRDRPGGRFPDRLADGLAMNLDLPIDTVCSALLLTFQEMPMDFPQMAPDFPRPPRQPRPGEPGAPFGPGERPDFARPPGERPDFMLPPGERPNFERPQRQQPPAGDGVPGGPPFAARGGFPLLRDDFTDKLAANLGLPPDTVRTALQQMAPPMPPAPGPDPLTP